MCRPPPPCPPHMTCICTSPHFTVDEAKRKAASGDGDAAGELGIWYGKGEKGLPKDDALSSDLAPERPIFDLARTKFD